MNNTYRNLKIVLIALISLSLHSEAVFAAPSSKQSRSIKNLKNKAKRLAQADTKRKKRKKRKNRRRKKVKMNKPAVQESIHSEQEGKDEPYSMELSLLSDFLRSETTTKNEGGGESKSGSGQYHLATEALWIMSSSFEIGGTINFSESSTKAGDDTLTNREAVVGVKAKMNFGNLDEDLSLFYGYVGLGFGQGTTQVSADDSQKESILQYGLGFGMHYFVDSNVAFTGELGADIASRKGEGYEKTTTNLHLAKLGFTLFI